MEVPAQLEEEKSNETGSKETLYIRRKVRVLLWGWKPLAPKISWACVMCLSHAASYSHGL